MKFRIEQKKKKKIFYQVARVKEKKTFKIRTKIEEYLKYDRNGD